MTAQFLTFHRYWEPPISSLMKNPNRRAAHFLTRLRPVFHLRPPIPSRDSAQ